MLNHLSSFTSCESSYIWEMVNVELGSVLLARAAYYLSKLACLKTQSNEPPWGILGQNQAIATAIK